MGMGGYDGDDEERSRLATKVPTGWLAGGLVGWLVCWLVG